MLGECTDHARRRLDARRAPLARSGRTRVAAGASRRDRTRRRTSISGIQRNRRSHRRSSNGAATSQNGNVAPSIAPPRVAGTHTSMITPQTSHAISAVSRVDDAGACEGVSRSDDSPPRDIGRRRRGGDAVCGETRDVTSMMLPLSRECRRSVQGRDLSRCDDTASRVAGRAGVTTSTCHNSRP